MIVVFASSLHSNDRQKELLFQSMNNSGKEFLFLNPLDYKSLDRIQLVSVGGLTKLYFEDKEVTPTTFFYSRLWRTDCIIDFPDNVIYPNLFRQKIHSFLEEIIFCFKEVKSFPGRYDDIRLGESKCALYSLAHVCGLDTPYVTTNSFRKPDNIDYRKVLGSPFSISLNTEMREEVAVTLLNEIDYSISSDLLGLPWQWQSQVKPQRHIRCVIVGKKVWTYSLDDKYLKSRSLREANDNGDTLIWKAESLPPEVEKNLLRLLKKIGLEYSSPEFLIDVNGNYIFIDLNPCGDWFGFSNEKDGSKIAQEIIARL